MNDKPDASWLGQILIIAIGGACAGLIVHAVQEANRPRKVEVIPTVNGGYQVVSA